MIPVKEPVFADHLREFRCAAGLSQEGLAERARMSPAAISALERSVRRAPQIQTVALLAEALELPQAQRASLEAAAAQARHRRPRPAGHASGSVPHNLPNILTSFHGRDRNLAEVGQLLQHRRLISLLGPGGVGKTRLAFEAGRAQVHNTLFADGIWLVELASLTDRSLVTTAIAGLLGVREQSKEPLVDTLVSAIGGKRLLLILDNCEHVIDECALVVERLTRYCSGVNILATTREPLRIDGECSLRVEPLAIDDSQVTAPALSLLIDRLIDTDVTRFSTMTSEDRAHALTICKRLDGIPLALELAASRAPRLLAE